MHIDPKAHKKGIAIASALMTINGVVRYWPQHQSLFNFVLSTCIMGVLGGLLWGSVGAWIYTKFWLSPRK